MRGGSLFFFQAEDGIRGLVRSGLGEVDKRQGLAEVYGGKVPTGPKGAGVKVRDKKEPIGRSEDRSGEFGSGGGASGW